MISINKLTVKYGSDIILNEVTLYLASSQILGIMGLNGAGKTTLLNTLFGLIKPDSGSVNFADQPLSKKHISYLPADNYFYPGITGAEYLKIFSGRDSVKLANWNELFHLPLNQVVEEFSTGMKKKLAIMGALIRDKEVLILDEPFNGLDLESCQLLNILLPRLAKKGKTIILTSHIAESLTATCDIIHYLDSGKISQSADKLHFNQLLANISSAIRTKTQHHIERVL